VRVAQPVSIKAAAEPMTSHRAPNVGTRLRISAPPLGPCLGAKVSRAPKPVELDTTRTRVLAIAARPSCDGVRTANRRASRWRRAEEVGERAQLDRRDIGHEAVAGG